MNIYSLDVPVEIMNFRQLKVLDVGAGFNPRLIADVMVNNVAVYAGKRTVAAKDRYYTADIEALPFKNKSFDLAITNHVFEHLRRPDTAFKELNRVAKKILIITPSSLRESRGTDDDHYWFVYGSGGRYVFEAIPPKFRNDMEKRERYNDKFSKLENELAIGDETVYYNKSIESDNVVSIIGEFDEQRFRNNHNRFRVDNESKKGQPNPFRKRVKLTIKYLLRKCILLTRRKLDPAEYLLSK